MKVEGLKLRSAEKNISGDIMISSLGDKLLKLKGALNIQGGRTIITPDIVIDLSHKNGAPAKISGDITSEKMMTEDIIGEQSIWSIITRLRDLTGYSIKLPDEQEKLPSLLSGYDLDMHVFLQNVETEHASYEALSFDVLKEAESLRIGEVTGKDELKLMPPVIVLERDSKLSLIMQGGELNKELLSSWLEVPPTLTNNVSCAIGEIHENEGSWELILSEKKTELSKEQYDFVQASLQKSGKNSPCEDYISIQKSEAGKSEVGKSEVGKSEDKKSEAGESEE